MRTYLLFCIFIFALTVDVKKEENVFVLTDKSFDDFIKEHDHVLVKFYVYSYITFIRLRNFVYNVHYKAGFIFI